MVPPLPIPSVVDITQCSRYDSACCTQEEMFQRNTGPSEASSLHMLVQELDLSARGSTALLSPTSVQRWRLFSHQLWSPTRALPLGTDCLVPALVQTRVLLEVGLLQGTKTCAHISSHKGRWRGRSLSLSCLVTARFPRGKNCGYMRATTGIEFQPLSCPALPGCAQAPSSPMWR